MILRTEPPPAPKTNGPVPLDRRTADKLRRGRLPIEARLDLHGMTQERARAALARFIEATSADGMRALLVITGKGGRGKGSADPGGRDAGEIGVLRREVPRWLAEAPFRGRVLSIEEAAIQHGGAGALYVLLRRQRGKTVS